MIGDEALLAEAYRHGRTQERLREVVMALQRVGAICREGRRSPKARLLEVEIDVRITLERLSVSTGGVIDDMEPLSTERAS